MADLVREIMVDASPATIFEYLTSADKIVEWHGSEAELDPRPGGVYRVRVADEHPSAGEYVEIVPNEKVVFTFGWDEPERWSFYLDRLAVVAPGGTVGPDRGSKPS